MKQTLQALSCSRTHTQFTDTPEPPHAAGTVAALRTALLLLFLLLFSFSSSAQLTQQWKTPPFKGGSTEIERYSTHAVDRSNHLVIASLNGGGESGNPRVTLFKYDETGRQIWAKVYAGWNNSVGETDVKMKLDPTGNIYVAARAHMSESNQTAVVLKFSPSGDLLWSRSAEENQLNVTAVSDLVLSESGSLYITGTGQEGGKSYLGLMKLNTGGTKVWEKKYFGLNEEGAIAYTLALDNRGSVFVATDAEKRWLGGDNFREAQTILLKYDTTDGELLFTKTYEIAPLPNAYTNYLYPRKILTAPSGVLYLVVQQYDGLYAYQTHLYKLSSTGDVLWREPLNNTQETLYLKAELAEDESVVLLAREFKYRNFWDYLVMKFNQNGQNSWKKTLNIYEGNRIGRIIPTDMAVSPTGEVALSGTRDSIFYYNPFPPVYDELARSTPTIVLYQADGQRVLLEKNEHVAGSRSYNSSLTFFPNKNLYVVGGITNDGYPTTYAHLTAMRYGSCSDFNPSAGQDQTICAGAQAQLNATGGITYTWSPATGLSATNIANPIARPAATTTYTVTVTNANGCIATDQVTITVNPLPQSTVTAGGATSICQGSSVILSANEGNGYTYQWTKDGTAIQGAAARTFAANSAGLYRVVVTSNTCSSTSEPTQVTVTTPQTLTLVLTASPFPVCSGVNTTYTARVLANATITWGNGSTTQPTVTGGTDVTNQFDFAWFRNAQQIQGAGAGSTYQLNNSEAGANYAVRATRKQAGSGTSCYIFSSENKPDGATGFDLYSNTLTPNQPVNYGVSITGPAGATCAGATATFTAQPNAAYASPAYQWLVNGQPVQGATNNTFGSSSLQNGDRISVRMSSAASSCGAVTSAEVPVVITPQPTASITAGGATSFCQGGSVVLTASAGSGYTYQWYRNNTTISGATAATYTATATGNYTVAVSVGSCTQTSAATTVTVTAELSNNTISSEQSICAGQQAAALTGSEPAGGTGTFAYQWESSTDNVNFVPAQGTINNQNYTPGTLNATTWFRRTVTSGTCSATSNAVRIMVNALPTATLAAFDQTCLTAPAFALTSGMPVGGTYSGPGVSNGQFNPATAGAGTHTITYTYRNTAGCEATATQVLVVQATCNVTAVADPEELKAFQVYPNPAVAYVQLELELKKQTSLTLRVVNAKGQLVHEQQFGKTSGTFKQTLDLRGKAKGIYMVQLVTDENILTKKVMLEL